MKTTTTQQHQQHQQQQRRQLQQAANRCWVSHLKSTTTSSSHLKSTTTSSSGRDYHIIQAPEASSCIRLFTPHAVHVVRLFPRAVKNPGRCNYSTTNCWLIFRYFIPGYFGQLRDRDGSAHPARLFLLPPLGEVRGSTPLIFFRRRYFALEVPFYPTRTGDLGDAGLSATEQTWNYIYMFISTRLLTSSVDGVGFFPHIKRMNDRTEVDNLGYMVCWWFRPPAAREQYCWHLKR